MSDPDKIAHLGFIQGVINRMGNNSFLLKGWGVALVAAIFALAAKDANPGFIVVAFYPVLLFWVLDAFFLHQEKLYRNLYDKVRTGAVPADFSLNAAEHRGDVMSVTAVFFSKTLVPFYGCLVGVIGLAFCLLPYLKLGC